MNGTILFSILIIGTFDNGGLAEYEQRRIARYFSWAKKPKEYREW